jgi:hypothetical protein
LGHLRPDAIDQAKELVMARRAERIIEACVGTRGSIVICPFQQQGLQPRFEASAQELIRVELGEIALDAIELCGDLDLACGLALNQLVEQELDERGRRGAIEK